MNQKPPRFIIHSLDQARAVLAALATIRPSRHTPLLLSSPGYAQTAGAPVFRAMMDRAHLEFPELTFTSAVDCGDAAGYAMAALREAVEGIVTELDEPARNRIMDIAAQQGCMVYCGDIYHGDLLDLDLCPHPREVCRNYLQSSGLHTA